jgi:hypothetical protein
VGSLNYSEFADAGASVSVEKSGTG